MVDRLVTIPQRTSVQPIGRSKEYGTDGIWRTHSQRAAPHAIRCARGGGSVGALSMSAYVDSFTFVAGGTPLADYSRHTGLPPEEGDARMRVLIVEDNAMNVEFFQDTLEAAGHVVVVERDGRRGLARAVADPFDVILLDIQMPQLDGAAVCRELRVAGVSTPILAVSAAAMPEQIARGKAAGFDEYLTKPISPGALRDAVARHALAGAQASQGSRS